MSIRYACSLLMVLVLICGCSKDSPTDPQDDDPYVLVTEATIGPTGGTIEADGLSLEIPPGAFAGERTVKLHVAADVRPFAANQATGSYRLTGIPAERSQSLRVCLKYEHALSEETYIAYGLKVFDEATREEQVIYELFAAADSAGHLRCELPAAGVGATRSSGGVPGPAAKAADSADVFDLLGLTGFRTHETEHFAIKHPISLVEVNMATVGAMLEEIYVSIAQTMQFAWPWAERVQTVVQQLASGCAASGGFLSDATQPTLNLSRDHLSQGHVGRVRESAGRTILLNVIRLADRAALTIDNYWLRHAVASWAAELFTADTEYRRPETFRDVEMAPFNGMRAGADIAGLEGELYHGFGMAAVIKYLTGDQRYTAAGIGRTYATISESNQRATAALLNNVDALVADWWPQFFRSYIGGEIYGVRKDVFTNSGNLAGSWTIASHADTLHTFIGQYPDLSAKLYMINLSNPALDDSAAMTLRLHGQSGYHEPWSLMAFGVGSESLAYWGQANGQGSTTLRIPELKNLYDAGWRQILIVAVCSNTSSAFLDDTDAELAVRITREATGAAYNSFDFRLRIVGHWRYVSGSYVNEYQGTLEEEPWGSVDVIPGEMVAADRFAGSFASLGATGEVIATLNATRDVLLSVQVVMNAEEAAGRSWSFSFSAADVPLWFDEETRTMFRITGAEACGYLPDVQYEYLYPAATESKTLLDYSCTSAGAYPSTLILSFHKRPR